MNDVIDQMIQRKSVRVFEEKQISQQDKQNILISAVNAPTAGNQQLYTIIDITDKALQDKLALSCDDQKFIAKAKMVLIFCADAEKWYRAYLAAGASARPPQVGDLMLAVCDALAAAQNAVCAAQSLGIGSCFIGDIMEKCEQHREMLNLPQYVFPVSMLVFGYPTSGQIARKKPQRFNLQDIVCQNKYVQKTDEELLQSFSCKETTGDIKEWLMQFCERKYNSDFSREMSRSVQEYLKSYI